MSVFSYSVDLWMQHISYTVGSFMCHNLFLNNRSVLVSIVAISVCKTIVAKWHIRYGFCPTDVQVLCGFLVPLWAIQGGCVAYCGQNGGAKCVTTRTAYGYYVMTRGTQGTGKSIGSGASPQAS